ncbi:MAG: dihydrodipicolinate synthase family protein [Alphaproteobacteria bacterium]|nr:dihydrodipicolinate synthase family protein [Alphaproteobacteria bacterium]
MIAPDPCPIAMRGIVPSLNTPFDRDGRVDEAAVARLVARSIEAGVAGMLLIAVAGEQASLTRDEKARIARIAVETAARRVPVIVSVTSPDAEEREALARLARQAGADGICCQVPAGLSGREIDDAMARVAAAGPDLLMIQDLDWGGGGLAIADIQRLFARIAQFRCLKIETVPAGPKYTRVLDATGGRLHVSGGWAVMQMPDALARGVHAFMPTALDAIYVAIHAAHRRGQPEAARALFERLLPIIAFSNQHVDVSIRFFKRLRAAEGVFATDHCRPPVAPLDAVQAAEAERMVLRALALQRDVVGVR